MNRLFSAELLKHRKRRGLLWSTLALIIGPVLLAYSITVVLHLVNPDRYGAAGGAENFDNGVDLLALFGLIASIIVGVGAGVGDLSAGVFRELVVTGRDRLVLFVVRIPGGLALLLPIVALAFALVLAASLAFAGSEPSPGAGLVARQGGFVLLQLSFAYVTAVGISSLMSSRGLAIGLLLGWHLAGAHLLLATGKLDSLLPNSALERLQPGLTGAPNISLLTAVAILVVWTAATVAAGAWRTVTREA